MWRCLRSLNLGTARANQRSTRSGVLLMVCLSLIGLAGCGGETAPSGYLCTFGRGTTDNGCYRQATWGESDPTMFIRSVSTDALVVRMACTGGCLTSATRDPAVAGSGASATGGIYNYLQLAEPAQNYFIRVGYGAIGGDGTSTYFFDYRLPMTDPTGASIIPTYRRVLLSSTGVPPTPPRGYRYTKLQILGARGGDGAGPFLDWYVCLALPATSGLNPFQTPTCTHLGSTEVTPEVLGDSAANGFDATQYSIGEHVYGTSGAAADYTVFTNTQFATEPAIGYEDLTGAQELSWQISSNNVALQQSTPAAVPFAGWIFTPAQRPTSAGMFWVECCQSVHISIG